MNKSSNNGPDESWDPLIYLAPNQLKEILSSKTADPTSTQNIFLKTNCVNEASGSSYIEIGNTKVLCSVYGPLKPSLFLHKYPKSQIDLYILCIQNDVDSKNILNASIIAASTALANASIELYDLVASYTYIPINLTVSFMPSLHQVTSIYFSNQLNGASLSVDLFKSHIKESIENCKKVYQFMKSVLNDSVNQTISKENKPSLMET